MNRHELSQTRKKGHIFLVVPVEWVIPSMAILFMTRGAFRLQSKRKFASAGNEFSLAASFGDFNLTKPSCIGACLGGFPEPTRQSVCNSSSSSLLSEFSKRAWCSLRTWRRIHMRRCVRGQGYYTRQQIGRRRNKGLAGHGLRGTVRQPAAPGPRKGVDPSPKPCKNHFRAK